jgi:hypothetical protein
MSTSLDTYIAELLYDYDCVIIPQLGGFVTNYRPARIDEKSGAAHPAGKDIRFNRNLTKNDGLLTQAFAHAEGWTFEQANAHIKTSVEEYLQKLNDGIKVKFKKIGVLYLDEHRNFRFEPSNDQNFLKSAIGFESFALPPLVEARKTPEILDDSDSVVLEKDQKIIKFAPPEPEPVFGSSGHSRSIYWVAAATLLPFIGLSIYVGVATNFKSPTDITFADLNPFGKKELVERRYTHRTSTVETENWTRWSNAINTPNAIGGTDAGTEGGMVYADTTSVDLPIADKSPIPGLTSGNYHIIGGCFREEGNADKFIEQAVEKGIRAAVLDKHNNLYRVKLESFERYDDAIKVLDSTRTSGAYPNAWLLKKPNS